MDQSTISFLIAMIGCFIGLAGWLAGRERKISNDSEWRGGINAKLDVLITTNTSTAGDVKVHAERLTAVEASAKQAHKRIDRIEKIKNEEI